MQLGHEHSDSARASFARAAQLDERARRQHAHEASQLLIGGWRQEAQALLRRGLELLPDDPELLHMIAATDGETPERAPARYVAEHFDRFAGSFDDVLVNRLGYKLPGVIVSALGRAVTRRDLDILDAGCGTGLCAAGLRPMARRLVGIDLSAGMIERAAALRLYDELVIADLLPWLDEVSESFDAILAADVVVYFGRLEPLIEAVTRRLHPAGALLFTTERSASASFTLDPSGRFSHDPDYVAQVAKAAGLVKPESTELSYRRELGEPVQSMLWTFRRG